MIKSNKKYRYNDVAFLYERLSRDDDLEGESYSIANQKKLLIKSAKDKGYTKVVHFFDDGISGVTMNRPEFQRMLEEIKLGKAGAVFVKDLSRLGRNYIEVGKLTEEFFPEHNIRLVAVSDGIDTAEGEDELAPIRNLFNEWYARDISKKKRASNRVKGTSGIPLGSPPYGYMKSADNPNFWVVDEEPASVIRRVDRLTFEGYGTDQIATMFKLEKILTPAAYAISKGINKPLKTNNPNPYAWTASMINRILAKQEYCGDVINFKTYSKSFKNKKRLQNDPDNIVIYEGVHEAIRDRSTFLKLEELRKNKTRKKKTSEGEYNMFSGLLVCADCGSNLHYHFNQRNNSIKYYNCPNYNKGKTKTCFSTHYIRLDFLEQIVLSEIRRLTKFACKYEANFTATVADYSKKLVETEQRIRQCELRTLIARDKELDTLFEKIYEDNVSGKISDDRFAKLSSKYEQEQESICDRIEQLKKVFDETNSKVDNTEVFLSAVKKYTRIKKLTPLILNELIEKIEVYHAEIINGVKKQKIVIYYNCIGNIVIPDEIPIPNVEIKLNTRQGVSLKYEPAVAI